MALLIVLISTYSYNAERTTDSELAGRYFRKGLASLKILNYRDALLYFSRAYRLDPTSEHGELSYLYLGKSYALYSYVFGSKRGVMASIGYLNQYPFHYKVPRFIHTQREFIGDAYLLLLWFDTAKNIYANLYGETEKPEYMIKYGYASALSGSIEGYRYLRELKEVPADYLDIYYMTMAFYNFNLGRYATAVDYMFEALNANSYLREDANLLFRLGVSYYKLGNWRKALLYLEMSLRNDAFGVYRERANFYLAFINLETKNYREAFANLRELTTEGRLFYSKLSQILFSSLWLYEEFLQVYGKSIGNYRDLLLQVGWLNVEDVFGELPALGIYYLSLRSGILNPEEEEFLRVKDLTLGEFVFEGDLFTLERFVPKVREPLREIRYYDEESARLISKLYKTNRNSFLKLFGDPQGTELLARVLVFLGDPEAERVLPYVADRGVSLLLQGKMHILRGDGEKAGAVLRTALSLLKGEDRQEATLLTAYLTGDPSLLEEAIGEIDFEHPRFSPYAVPAFLRLADLFYQRGKLKKALSYYREVVRRSGSESEERWWALFRLAIIAERLRDEETLKWVVKEAKDKDNIWSRVIATLWEG